jgi:hypothetical protein
MSISKETWYLMNDYPINKEENEINNFKLIMNEEKERNDKIEKKLDILYEIIIKIDNQQNILNNFIINEIKQVNNKLEKIIESNKSLIAYFNAINQRDIRELNYKIRGYSSKNFPAINFVKEKSNKNI